MYPSTTRLLGLSLLLAQLCLRGQAVPAPGIAGKDQAFTLSRAEVAELGRLAKIVNAAHCPSHRHLQPGGALTPSPRSLPRQSSQGSEVESSTTDTDSRPRGAFSANGLERGSNIIASSHDSRMEASFQRNHGHADMEATDDVNWYISHSPASNSLTLSLSSLTDTDSYIQMLSSPPAPSNLAQRAIQKHLKGHSSQDSLLVPLPRVLFPERLLEEHFPSGTPRPRIHHALVEPLLKDGPSLVLTLLDLVQSQRGTQQIEKLHVVGHGLGSSIGMLVALSVHLHLADPVNAAIAAKTLSQLESVPSASSLPLSSPPLEENDGSTIFGKVLEQVGAASKASWWKRRGASAASSSKSVPLDITADLFSMNRIGDLVFAQWIDRLIDSSTSDSKNTLSISRINSYADPVPHLPAPWQGFAHFRATEIWIDSDPRTVWSCVQSTEDEVVGDLKERKYEGHSCLSSVPLDKASLLDHAGPFGGVWMGGDECR